MKVFFEKLYLRELYFGLPLSDKKHRFQPDIVNRYRRCINYMKAAPKLADLRAAKSLHLENLIGDKQGLLSVRVNLQYRIEFSVSEDADEPSMTICNIIDLSNHYK